MIFSPHTTAVPAAPLPRDRHAGDHVVADGAPAAAAGGAGCYGLSDCRLPLPGEQRLIAVPGHAVIIVIIQAQRQAASRIERVR
jgi:hypothetical protein